MMRGMMQLFKQRWHGFRTPVDLCGSFPLSSSIISLGDVICFCQEVKRALQQRQVAAPLRTGLGKDGSQKARGEPCAIDQQVFF